MAAEELIFRVETNENYGRYLVANRLIKQGQLILKEKPAFLCTQLRDPVICFKCYRRLRKVFFCSNCSKALLCNSKCSGTYHDSSECHVLKSLPIEGSAILSNPEIATMLRCLILRQSDHELFNEILNMESHIEKRRNTPIWRRNQINIETILKEFKIIDENDIKNELVQKLSGILDVNTFQVRQPNFTTNPGLETLRGLYIKSALMAHNCLANTHLAVDDDFVLYIHAAVDIPAGHAIYFNYANALRGNVERNAFLSDGKYFKCCCDRCLDPTEFGTEISSLICPRCRDKGIIRPDLWQCSGCGKKFNEKLIKITIDEAKRRIYDLDFRDILALEGFLKKLHMTFHAQHYLALQIEQELVRLYASPTTTNKKYLIRKIDLCNKLLGVFKKVEPGISRIQAITQYELHSGLVNLAQKEFNGQEISAAEFVQRLNTAETVLKDSIKQLLYEPQKSPEGKLAQNALHELKMLRVSISNLQQSLLDDKRTSRKNRKKSRN